MRGFQVAKTVSSKNTRTKSAANKSSKEWMLEDFRSSAVPDRLTLANVQWVEGDEAIEVLTENLIASIQKVTSYQTAPASRILLKYQFAAGGGWLAYGCDPEGITSGKVPYFKPRKPRKELDNGKLKTIKYETAAKAEALPILPWVDDETAQAIYQRYGVTPVEEETFWQVVRRCNLPIAITEGLKKALSKIAHGIPAIALRGIACWHRKGVDELHQAIAHFATPKRTVYIAFDQDEKPSTQRDVRHQILKLGNTLEQLGCIVRVPVWDQKLGKGVDDALYGLKEEAQSWFNTLLQNAPSLKDYKRHGRVTAALAAINQLNQLSYSVERETEGEYLPTLPELQKGAIHVLTASMDSGKTWRIGKDWVRSAIASGYNVLVLCPLNSLGQQTATNWELPHIHHFGTSTEQQMALSSMVSAEHGFVMCPESMHRIPTWFWDRPVLLILDEANQIVDSLVEGDTLGSRWPDILERLTAAARHAISTGAIVLSEDGIPNRTVDYIKQISGSDTIRVFQHRKQGKPWDCTVFSGQASGYRARMLQAIRRGDLVLCVTSSQQEAKRLERALAKISKTIKVVRIDSETNQQGTFNTFFDDPDSWLAANKPDVLILSPSAKSGVSIQGNVAAENAYFSSVWGYFPALATDTHMQLLGRYRPAVPRFIFVPPFILAGGDESLLYPRAIKRRLGQNLKAISGVYELDELLESTGDRSELMATIENAAANYYAEARSVSGLQKSIAHDALVKRLETAGHSVRLRQLSKDSQTVELWKEVQEEIWREDANAIASSIIDPNHHTLDWARKTLDLLESSLEIRTVARKVLWREEFPGVLFDDPEECYRVLCEDYGSMRRGVLLQAKAENLEATKEGDRRSVEAILKGRIRNIHKLPKNYFKSLVLAKTGILDLLNNQPYSNTDKRAIAIKKAALYWAKEISYWLRLTINPTQTPVEICNKLLKRLNLKGDPIGRPGRRGEKRDQIFSVLGLDDPVRLRLLEAAKRKLFEFVSPICNRNQDLLQINDTVKTAHSPHPHNRAEAAIFGPCDRNWFSPESLADVRGWWEATDSEEIKAEIRRIVPPDVLERAIA